jgi:hypothetical protein
MNSRSGFTAVTPDGELLVVWRQQKRIWQTLEHSIKSVNVSFCRRLPISHKGDAALLFKIIKYLFNIETIISRHGSP